MGYPVNNEWRKTHSFQCVKCKVPANRIKCFSKINFNSTPWFPNRPMIVLNNLMAQKDSIYNPPSMNECRLIPANEGR